MKYETFENIIIERLGCPGLDVRTKEISQAELNRYSQNAKPIVYVLYQGSTYDDPETLGVIAQRETLTFDVIVFARKQRGEKGAFAAFETITGRLLGYRGKGMLTPVVFSKFGYVSETNTTYQYALQCTFTGYIVETPEEEGQLPPLIKKITNNITAV